MIPGSRTSPDTLNWSTTMARTRTQRRNGGKNRQRTATPSRARTPEDVAPPTTPPGDDTRLFPTKNDLPEDKRVEVIGLLNQRLAEAIDLQTQCKQAHWNVKGPSFIGLHKLFDDVNEEIGRASCRERV